MRRRRAGGAVRQRLPAPRRPAHVRGGPPLPARRADRAPRDRGALGPLPRRRRGLRPGLAKGKYDAYLLMPRGNRDEEFHNAITELLSDWTSTVPAARGGERQGHLAGPRRAHHGDPRLPRPDGHAEQRLPPRRPAPPGVHGGHPRGARRRGARATRSSWSPARVAIQATSVRDVARSDLPPHRGRCSTRSSTSRSSAPVRPGWRPPCTPPRRGSTVRVLEAEAIGGQAGTSSMIRNYLGFPRGISGMRLALAGPQPGDPLRHQVPHRAGRSPGSSPARDGEPHVLRMRRRRGPRPRRADLQRRGLPQARRTRARGAGRQRRQLRRRDDRGPGDGGVRRRRGRRRQLRRPGRAAPVPGSRAR